MKLIRVPFAVAVAATTMFASCGDDDAGDSGDYAVWCSEYEELALEVDRVAVQPSIPPDPASPEMQALGESFEAFADLPVPEPIRADFDASLPRGTLRPEPDERVRARLAVAEWVQDNCAMGDEFAAAVEQQIIDDRESLGTNSPAG